MKSNRFLHSDHIRMWSKGGQWSPPQPPKPIFSPNMKFRLKWRSKHRYAIWGWSSHLCVSAPISQVRTMWDLFWEATGFSLLLFPGEILQEISILQSASSQRSIDKGQMSLQVSLFPRWTLTIPLSTCLVLIRFQKCGLIHIIV